MDVGTLTASVAAAVLTAVVLTIRDPDAGLRVVTATLAAVASLLALIDNQLDLRVRAAEHRRTGAGYSKVRRALETFAQKEVQDLAETLFSDPRPAARDRAPRTPDTTHGISRIAV